MNSNLNEKNIVLTGFMGAGKSSVAKALSVKLSLKLVDTDELIEKNAGLSVREIFAKFGEARFRELEKEAISSLFALKGSGYVVSTGGGAVVDPDNRANLKRFGIVVWLKADIREIMARVGKGADRPLLKDASSMQELLSEREGFYKEAGLTIDTTGIEIDKVIEKIVEYYNA